jgi:hypothetical protein
MHQNSDYRDPQSPMKNILAISYSSPISSQLIHSINSNVQDGLCIVGSQDSHNTTSLLDLCRRWKFISNNPVRGT